MVNYGNSFLKFSLFFIYSFQSFTISVELVPPKPNELLRNMSKWVYLVSGSTLMQAVSSSGFSKFRLPPMKSFFIISIE